jgi:undecaprenyl-diphosphatase
MGNFPRRLANWLRQGDLVVLLAVLLVVVGALVFLLVADAVRKGTTQSLDERILLALRQPDHLERPIGPPALAEAGRDLTALGGVAFMALLTAAVAVYLLLCRRWTALALLAAAAGGGLLLSLLLKGVFHRDRPQVVPQLSYVDTTSFPSGHSMNAAIIYLTLGTLLARITPGRILRIYFISLALLLTFLVGASRVYVGVHYPTDVLAGWTAGLAWAVFCWLVARSLRA